MRRETLIISSVSLSPNAYYPNQLHKDYVDRTYDNNHCSKQVHWDRSTSIESASDDTVDEEDQQH